MITPDQIRAARALKGWSQTELADRTGLSVPTIANIELGKQIPSNRTLQNIIECFDEGGIEFIGSRGLQEKHRRVKIYSGVSGFKRFLDDIYETAINEGGEFCLFNAKPDNWNKLLGDFMDKIHGPRMASIRSNIDFKITTQEGETNFISRDFATYRWVPKTLFNEKAAFYVYGGKVAFIDFRDNDVSISVINQPQAAQAMRIVFNSAWDHLTIDTPPH